MAKVQPSPGPVANWALASLPRGDYEQLLPSLEPVPLNFGEVLHEAGQRVPYVYFPSGGLVSLLATEDGGRQAEVAVVGNEGVVGLPVVLGNDVAPHRAVVQGTGQALRITAELFRSKARPHESLTALLLRYTDAFLVQVSQSALCDHLHPVQKRLCRWLLMAQDRMGSDRLPFTQKFMADILAVRLASVSEAARPLQQAGLIHYNRGDLRILDRPGLERACCGCYRVIKERFDALQGLTGSV
jgi:CRP-like cAMP-binding protein